MSGVLNYPTSVYAVANWFIKKSRETQKKITHMKLQKLVYMAYGWYYAYYGEPLFKDDIVAWTHGPVVPSLYLVLKNYGRQPIDHLVEKGTRTDRDELESQDYTIHFSEKELCNLSEQEKTERIEIEKGIESILSIVWRDYSDLTAGQLRNLTHRPETPWGQLFERFQGNIQNRIIDPIRIQEYFDNLVQKYGEME
jgi:uncharacterized phage-associated protein